MKRLIAALSILGCTFLAPIGVARADCDTPGDFGAGSGCPPPGADTSGGGGTESWPPTSVDWPPQFDSALSGGDSDKSKPAPIVMPDGMAPPPASATQAPIVGAGSASGTPTSTTTTPIVVPGS